jgi:hypothetical protein
MDVAGPLLSAAACTQPQEIAVPKNRMKRDVEGTHLRLLAWVLAALVAAASLLSPRGYQSLLLELGAALIFAVGAVWPRSFRWLKRLLTGMVLPFRGRRLGA